MSSNKVKLGVVTRLLCTIALIFLGFAIESGQAVVAAPSIAKGDTSGMRIGFSTSYSGSSFRQVMNKDWQRVCSEAKRGHLIAGCGLVSANNNVTEQASQIQNMILDGYKAIVVLPGSDTALDGAVNAACNAGVVVVVVAGKVHDKCAYDVNYNWASMGKQEVSYLAKKLHGKGNLLEIRGIAGTATDKDIHDGIRNALKPYPGLKVVGTVYGQWTETVAQKAVATILPTLPKIAGVVDQGGDGYGAAQAFAASGRPIPMIIMGNRWSELHWWKKQNAKDGYKTMSLGATPSVSQVAFWVAQQILAGKQVPHHIQVPLLVIHRPQLNAWLRVTPKGGVADPNYSLKLVSKMINANIKGAKLPSIPAPKA